MAPTPARRRRRVTLGDRITRSRLPVTGSLDPRENPPLAIASTVGVLLALTVDLPPAGRVAVVVVALVVGAATQYFTVAAANVREGAGPVVRDPDGGQLRHRDEAADLHRRGRTRDQVADELGPDAGD